MALEKKDHILRLLFIFYFIKGWATYRQLFKKKSNNLESNLSGVNEKLEYFKNNIDRLIRDNSYDP